MKYTHFLLLFVLLTQLQLECKGISEPFIFEPADSEKRATDVWKRHEATSVKPLKECEREITGPGPSDEMPAEDDSDGDEEQSHVSDEDEAPATLGWDEIRNKLHASLTLVSRCSRRFYPGMCGEPVHSVWAYSFSRQTCIERLGCKQINKRSNRFGSYVECMQKCKALIEVYTHILAHQENESGDDRNSDVYSDEYYDDDDSMRKGKGTRRKSIETLENLISTVEEYTDDEQSHAMPESSEGQPPEEVRREMPVDIDSVPADYMDVQYDFNTNRYRSPRQN